MQVVTHNLPNNFPLGKYNVNSYENKYIEKQSYPTRLWKMEYFDIFAKLFLEIIVKSFLIKYDNNID